MKKPKLTDAEKLELAAIVLRYLRGDSLSEADEYRAKEAIKKADTVPAKAQATA